MIRSEQLFRRAQELIPGGVNSPVRAFKAVGGSPIFFERGEGPYLYSVDGKRYIDYVGAWGPLILGHAHPEVVRAVQEQAAKGLGFGAPTELEVQMAELLCRLVPSLERARLTNSGTEATMSAIRLARGYTGRSKVVKFEGGYHGHVDALLVKSGSGALTFGTPTSPGIPPAVARDTLILPYNDLEAVRACFAKMGEEIACVIVEPVAGNMNCVPPVEGFLETLREVCDRYGSVLIFDEVMTGFRVALGGAQERYGVLPDLTTLGKVIGGGLPVGAFGGKREIMDLLAPEGPVYQAGTLSGNPITVAAGLKTLELVSREGFFEALEARTKRLVSELERLAQEAGLPLKTHAVGGMFGIFFTNRPVRTFADVMASDRERFKRFFHLMLEEGVYLAPSPFEAGFVSAAHTDEVIEATLTAAENVFRKL